VTLINAGVINTGSGDVNVTGSVIGHQIVGQRLNRQVDPGAHFGPALNTYLADVSPAGQSGFSYRFPAADDQAATDAFEASMADLPDQTTAELYRLDGDDRRQVASWPRPA